MPLSQDSKNVKRRQRWAEDAEYRQAELDRRQARQNPIQKRKRNRIKEEVFEHYGNKCACCGEDHPEFLTIDHINGRPAEHKGKNGIWLYKIVKAEGFPDTYQILCWNCNAAKGLYGLCPHERS